MPRMLETAKNVIKGLRTLGLPPVQQVDIEKRNGLYVSRLLTAESAKKWNDWAVKYGVPNPVPADQLHVTILHSTVDVKVPMLELPLVITTAGSYYGEGGVFCMMGPNDESFTYCFREYELHDRHHQFIYAGAVSKWDSYRPHLTLSNDAKGFEISDEALADVPRYIILGPEVNGEPRTIDPGDMLQDGDTEEGDSILVIVIERAAEDAKAILAADAEKKELSPLDAYALKDVAAKQVTRGVAKRLASIEGMPEAIKDLAKAEPAPKTAPVRKRIESEVVVSVSALPDSIAKSIRTVDLFKDNDEERIVMGIASVSTVNGELVKDLHGDFVTTKALREFNRSLIAGTREGKFDHEGEAVTEIVAGLVLSQEWQKSLGIDLGYEPYLTEIHVPGDGDWAEVKKGDWMLSIAGTMWHYEEAAS